MFWQQRILIVFLMIVCMAVTYIKVAYFTQETYTSNAVLYVSNKDISEGDSVTQINKSDIDSSRSLNTTCIEILKTRSFLTSVSDSIGRQFSYSQIKGMLQMTSMNETELLSIAVTANNPKDAYLVADAIMKLAPTKLSSIYKSGGIETVDSAQVPSGPNSNKMLRKLGIAALVGFAIGCAYAFLVNYFDNKVHDSSDVSERYSVFVLGEIVQ